ncbi:MAG: hypothetical protein DHS20C11_08150 [Lysobacteraceae bacterium]|nr:MAG: hypothetical protein DHS20C11_08150 [Xanthomonadaceae bacterium]
MLTKLLNVMFITAVMLIAVTANAADPKDPIRKLLFPPELIMQNRDALALSAEQQEVIKTELHRTRSEAFDLQWQLDDEVKALTALLEESPIDEASALDQADKVMALEQQVKRIQLRLLTRLKNSLTAEQIAILEEARQERFSNGQRRMGSRFRGGAVRNGAK